MPDIQTQTRPAQFATSHWLRVAVSDACAPVCVQFFSDTEARQSPVYGPYAFLQMMYGTLRGILAQEPRTEEVIADYVPETGLWHAQDRQTYSDMLTYSPSWATLMADRRNEGEKP